MVRNPASNAAVLPDRNAESPRVMSASELIHLAVDLSHYHTDYLWKMPGSWEGYPYYSSPEFYEDIARMASRGVMDLLFFGDSGGTPEDYGGNHHTAVRYGTKWPRHDMMALRSIRQGSLGRRDHHVRGHGSGHAGA